MYVIYFKHASFVLNIKTKNIVGYFNFCKLLDYKYDKNQKQVIDENEM